MELSNVLRRYDLAVLDALKIKLDVGTVPINSAGSRREFGTQQEITGQDPTLPGQNANANKTVAYPAMVVTRLNWEPSDERTMLAKHRHLGWTDDLNGIYQAQHALAWDIHYQLDIYTKHADDLNLLTAVTAVRFPRKRKVLKVDLGHPWGEKNVYLWIGNMVDNSVLEGDEMQDRLSRGTFDLTLHAWLPVPPVEVRTVRKVIATCTIDWFESGRGQDAVAFEKTVQEG